MGYQPAHKRMKRKVGAEPTAKQKAHMARVAQLPCLVCGARPVHVHHVTASSHVMGRLPKNDELVAPLCPRHHKIEFGPHDSVERLNHRGFYKQHGIDLLAEAEFLRLESIQEGIL